MQSDPNIEKSAFQRGEYVGYGGGRVWRIRKITNGWIARASGNFLSYTEYFQPTLASLSDLLGKLESE